MCCFLALVAFAGLAADGTQLPPELETRVARSDYGMVATGSPEATMAGVEILERGGNAVDAAAAAALALGVSDPDASGLGGITYLLVHLADGPTVAVDGSAVAPVAVDNARLQAIKDAGEEHGYELVAVPTTLAVLDTALTRFGTMDLATVLEPAIKIAEDGYRLSSLQILWTEKYLPGILASEYLRFIALEDGRHLGRPGDLHCRPDLLRTLQRLAREGVESFYRGNIAAEIDADMRRQGGFLRRSDLVRTRTRMRSPLTVDYRGVTVHAFPPPGAGPALVQTLEILKEFPSELLAEDSPTRHHVLLEASRIALVDGRRSAAMSQGPWGRTSHDSASHAADWARAITPGRRLPREALGPQPDPSCAASVGESTTQVSVVDSEGNVVSLTQTIGQSFGAAVATPGLGFPYNALLEAFNFDRPECPGFLRPGTLIETDMTPTIALRGRELVAALGSPGSNRIPAIVATVLSHMIDRGMALGDAVAAPRVLWGGVTGLRAFVEIAPPVSAGVADELESWGFEGMTRVVFPPDVTELVKLGGVNAVAFDPATGAYVGVVDPRRGGLAEGPRAVVQR
jgi:gamma-glutamyltranspeptidase/glutathione hydrolase